MSVVAVDIATCSPSLSSLPLSRPQRKSQCSMISPFSCRSLIRASSYVTSLPSNRVILPPQATSPSEPTNSVPSRSEQPEIWRPIACTCTESP